MLKLFKKKDKNKTEQNNRQKYSSNNDSSQNITNTHYANEKTFSDEELFYLLKKDGIYLTDSEIQQVWNGDGKILNDIGLEYYSRKDYPKALAWLYKTVPLNISSAQYRIGNIYRYGQGVRQDYKLAMYWYLKSVDNDGNKYAQNYIGLLYKRGNGVPKSIPTAMKWYRKAADQGYSVAQYNLAWNYESEDEVKDLQKAANWYKKAADNGYQDANIGLEILHAQGYYPNGEIKVKEKRINDSYVPKTEDPHSNKRRKETGYKRIDDNKELPKPPIESQTDDEMNMLMEEKIKLLEEAFQRELKLIQQDKMDKDDLQKKLDSIEKDRAKIVDQKDAEIKQLKEALAQAKAALDGDPYNDICYDSSNEEDNHSDTMHKDDNDDNCENDINYDSTPEDDDFNNDFNYDSSDNEDRNKN